MESPANWQGHLETIWPALNKPRHTLPLQRTYWDTPDGDRIAVDALDSAAPDAPILVLWHGLEGGSNSHYARQLFAAAGARGWRMLLPHFRSCGGIDNQCPRAYHAGDADEIDWVLHAIHARWPAAPLYLSGVSLGANALLKWLGQAHRIRPKTLVAAASASAPVNLAAAGHGLTQGTNHWLYGNMFLRTLLPKAKRIMARHPELTAQLGNLKWEKIQTLADFDDFFTAPLHGFKSVDDYWSRASSLGDLSHITTPTLLLHAHNDPFMPGRYLPAMDALSPAIQPLFTAHGGHAGFGGAQPVSTYFFTFFEQFRTVNPA